VKKFVVGRRGNSIRRAIALGLDMPDRALEKLVTV
jgi:hypothetical protein